MKNNWRAAAVCLGLAATLSACGGAPQARGLPPTSANDTPGDVDDDKPSDGPVQTRAPGVPKLGDAIAILGAGPGQALMGASEPQPNWEEGKFKRLDECVSEDEANEIAEKEGKDKKDLWMLTHSRAKVVFYYNPDDENLELLSTEKSE